MISVASKITLMIAKPWTVKKKVLQCSQSTNLQKHLLFVEDTKTRDNKNGDMKHEHTPTLTLKYIVVEYAL